MKYECKMAKQWRWYGGKVENSKSERRSADLALSLYFGSRKLGFDVEEAVKIHEYGS